MSIGFLWACLALFDDDAPAPDTAVRYRPVWEQLHSAAEAQERMLRILEESREVRGAEPLTLAHCLPETTAGTDEEGTPLRDHILRASAWITTFSASLELAKQGEVVLAQEQAFARIKLRSPQNAIPRRREESRIDEQAAVVSS